MTLEAAAAAARKQDFGVARDALIPVWRTRRSPVLAELITTLDRQEPDAISAAISAIVTPRAASSLSRLRALGELDDPRLATFAIDSLVNLPFTTIGAKKFLLALAATAARHRDPRLSQRAPEIRAALTTRIGHLEMRTPMLRAIQRATAPLEPPTPAEAALERVLAELVEPLNKRLRSADALLDAIYANPADDEPRLVYADLLSELGDPRGEFIALQLANSEPSARETELLASHGKAWLGVLAPVLSWGKDYSRTRFRRGFVAKADIMLSVGKKLEPILSHPAWSTIETFDRFYSDRSNLLTHAPLRALRELDVNHELVEHLAKRIDKLTSVTRVTLSYPLCTREALHVALPNLVTVSSYWANPSSEALAEWIAFGTPHLELFHNSDGTAAARARMAKFVTELVGTPAPLERLTLHIVARHHADKETPIELVRNAEGRYAKLIGVATTTR